MPSVCIDSSALSEGRFWKLSYELGMTREQTIGTLFCMWNDSQERGIFQGKREEILKFTNEKLFESLVRHDYISKIDDDLYEIKGNRKRLALPKDIPGKKKKPAPLSREAWNIYSQEYKSKFKVDPPPPGAKGFSQLCILIKTYGDEKVIAAIQHYFKMSDGFYKTNFYSLGTLVTQFGRIYGSMTTGLDMSRAKVIQMEKSQAIQQTLMDIEQGAI